MKPTGTGGATPYTIRGCDMDMGVYELTAIVVFKSLWWIIPCIVGLTAAVVAEYIDIL